MKNIDFTEAESIFLLLSSTVERQWAYFNRLGSLGQLTPQVWGSVSAALL